MDATEGTSVGVLVELDMRLHCCDICGQVATSPIATNCGHFFCRSCLNEVFRGEQARPCPVCRADLLEETAQSFPIDTSGAPAQPTPAATDSEIPNAGHRSPMTADSSLISIARMEVVQDYLEEETEHIHNIQLNLIRRVSDRRGERIRELEQVVETLLHMNLEVLRKLEACEHDRQRLSRRIEELENPTVHGSTAFARRHRRLGRSVAPTPTASENVEAGPESVEGRLFTTND